MAHAVSAEHTDFEVDHVLKVLACAAVTRHVLEVQLERTPEVVEVRGATAGPNCFAAKAEKVKRLGLEVEHSLRVQEGFVGHQEAGEHDLPEADLAKVLCSHFQV